VAIVGGSVVLRVGTCEMRDIVGVLVTTLEVGNFAIGIAVIDRSIGANMGVLPTVGRGVTGKLVAVGVIALAVGSDVKSSVSGFVVAVGTLVIPVRGKIPKLEGRGAICAGSVVVERTGVPVSTMLEGRGAVPDTLSVVVGCVLALESIAGLLTGTGK
jgi:hypothetical protein